MNRLRYQTVKRFVMVVMKNSTLRAQLSSITFVQKKHGKRKERLQEKATREVDIVEALSKHNLEEHLRGETLVPKALE